MKRLLIGILALTGIVATPARAQEISYGVKAEWNISNYIVKNAVQVKSDMKSGVTLGGFAKMDITNAFAVQPELLVHYQNSDYRAKSGGRVDNLTYWGLEIPVYALGQLHTKSGNRLYAGIGPYVGYGLSLKLDQKPKVDFYDKEDYQRWDFGGKVTVGYEFAAGLQFNVSYRIGVINAVDKKDDQKMLPQALSFGVGFRF
ncbi:MAG: PorT family protein [Rikenellaceae bacterium]|nr:PorT family protein [Rikenellaceae bacterium]